MSDKTLVPKPCPFCGASPACASAYNAPEWWVIVCENPRCGVSVQVEEEGRDEALEVWNTRHAS